MWDIHARSFAADVLCLTRAGCYVGALHLVAGRCEITPVSIHGSKQIMTKELGTII